MTVPNRPKEGIYTFLEKEISRKASCIRRHGPELYYIYIYIYEYRHSIAPFVSA